MMSLLHFVIGLVQRSRKASSRLLVLPTPRSILRYRMRPRLERLEDRTLLATWQPIGPVPQHDPNGASYYPKEDVTGRVSALAISANYDHEYHSALFLGAASGGIWRSTDFPGANPTWDTKTDSQGFPITAAGKGAGALHIGAIAVDPNNPWIIYAGTGEANRTNDKLGDTEYGTGILKSIDGGDSWNLISQGPNDVFFRRSISSLFVDPTHSQHVYAAVVSSGPNALNSLGIYKSVDGGKTWGEGPIGQAWLGAGATVTSLDYTQTDKTDITIYAGVKNKGIFRSTDGGTTWAPLAGRWPTGKDEGKIGRVSLAADHHPVKRWSMRRLLIARPQVTQVR